MKSSFLIMDNWAITLSKLDDELAGKLIKAICLYQITGEIHNTDSTVEAILSGWKDQMDANNKAYLSKVEGAKKAREKKDIKNNQSLMSVDIKKHQSCIKSDTASDTDTVTDTNTDKDIYNPPYIPPRGRETPNDIIDNSDLDEVTKQNVKTWVSYKQEQFRFKYKPTGLKALITEIKNKEPTLGAEGIEKAINLSMAKGYKGIIWDLVNGQQTSPYMQAIRDRVNVVDSWVIGGADDG